MMDTILGVETSEFVANRQYAKIQYLQEENKQLQEQLNDTEKALKLNKEILRLTFEQNLNNSNNSTNSSEQTQVIQLQLKLHEENEIMRNQMARLTNERNLAQNKVLLSQQISEENQAFYKDLIIELEEKLIELRRCIQDKEYTIQDIEKNRGLIDNQQMVKIREIVTPHEQSLRLNEELESTRQILNKISQESQNLQEQNKYLKEINQNFKRDLTKVLIVLRSPLAYYKMKNFIYNEDEGKSEDNLSFNEQIQQNCGSNSSPIQLHTQNQFINQGGLQQQSLTATKYITNNERASYTEKQQKTESILKGYKELFEREKNKVNILVQQKEEMEKKIIECYSYNEQIIKGIKSRDQKIQQLQAEVQFYRNQNNNYIQFIKNKRKFNLNLSFQQKEQTKNLLINPLPIQNTNNKILIDIEKDQEQAEQHVSILDGYVEQQSPQIQNHDDLQDQQKPQKKISKILEYNQSEMNFQECKQYLVNGAKEFFIYYNLKMNNLKKKSLINLKNVMKKTPIWHSKSNSDPLDYFMQQQIFSKNEIKNNGDMAKAPIQQPSNEPGIGWDSLIDDISFIQGDKTKQFISEHFAMNDLALINK